MKVALITPTKYLDMAEEQKVQMSLAHRVLADRTYAAWFKRLPRRGSLPPLVIMDNSLIELGYALPLSDILQAAEMCGAGEIILPDVFRDGERTVEAVQAALTEIKQTTSAVPFGKMAVAHGRSREEWLWCFDTLSEMEGVDTIGIPKVLDEIWQPGGRIGCTQYLERTGRIDTRARSYHLLGIWTDPVEILCQAHHDWIRSVDTALAFHAGMLGIRFTEHGLPNGVRPRRPHRYFDYKDLPPEHEADVKYNIAMLSSWAHGFSAMQTEKEC
jgi:hypothetical protein